MFSGKAATIGCLQGRVAADMGCTPSIHLSQTGVVYCREAEDSNIPHTSGLNSSLYTAHSHAIKSDASVTAAGVSMTDGEHILAAATSSASGSTTDKGNLSSSNRADYKTVNRSSSAGGSFAWGSSELEQRTSNQNMKVN